MTAWERVAAVLVGLAGMVLALAAALREVVVAADDAVTWRSSGTLRRLTDDPDWLTAVVAVGAAVVAVALIVLAVRQFRPADGGPTVIQFQDAAGWARLDVRAMERGMRRRLEASLPGVRVQDVKLRKAGDVWRITVSADVPGRDLQPLRGRMYELLREDLQSTGGMRLARLDLVVGQLVAAP